MVPRAYTIIGATTAAVLTAVLAASISRQSFMGSRRDGARLLPGDVGGAANGPPVRAPDRGTIRVPTTVAVSVTVGLIALYAIGLLIFLIWAKWHGEPEEPDPTMEVDTANGDRLQPWQTILSVDLHSAAEAQLAVIQRGTPRNAIVACWMALQEASLGAGLSRITSETADEFTLRAIRGLALDPRAVSALAALYREARFSDHVMREHQRDQAGAALRVLADQLAGRGDVRDPRRLADSPQ